MPCAKAWRQGWLRGPKGARGGKARGVARAGSEGPLRSQQEGGLLPRALGTLERGGAARLLACFLFRRLLPCFQVGKDLGGDGEWKRDPPSADGRGSGQSSQGGRRKKPAFPALNALVLGDSAHVRASLPSLERQELSAEKSQKSEDYRFARGLSLLSHGRPSTLPAPCCLWAQLSLPSGRPRQQLTVVRPGALRPARLPAPAPPWRTALSTGWCLRLYLPLPRKLGRHGSRWHARMGSGV